MIQFIEELQPTDELTPARIAEETGMQIETCKGVLNRNRDIYVPLRVNENNGHRFYGKDTMMKLMVRRALRKKPGSMNDREINGLFSQKGILPQLWNAYKDSKKACKRLAMDLSDTARD